MLKRLLLILLLVPFGLMGQNTDKYQEQDLVYEKEVTFGVKLLTNGFGVAVNSKRIHTIKKKTVWQYEFLELKHPIEYRQQSILPSPRGTPKSYIYGKRNNFFNLNVLYGREKTLARKGRKNGVSLEWFWRLGPSLGILKPYHLTLRYPDGERRNEGYSEENANFFLNRINIIGSTGFAAGLNEIKIKPGIVGKASLGADWANKKDYIKALEVGVIANVYPGDVEIMINEDNSFIFLNLYLELLVGRRK